MVSHWFHLPFEDESVKRQRKSQMKRTEKTDQKKILRSRECWISLSVNAKIMDYHEYCINYNICDRKRDPLGGRMLSTRRVWEAGTEHRGTSTQKGTGWGVPRISVLHHFHCSRWHSQYLFWAPEAEGNVSIVTIFPQFIFS